MADSGMIPSEVPSGPPAQQPPADQRYTVFRGPNGIRAGWRVLIYLAISAAMFFVLLSGIGLIARNRYLTFTQLTPLGTGISEGFLFLLAAIPALIMARIERRRFGVYGLPARSAFRGDFWMGGLAGFCSISLALLGIFVRGGFRISGVAIRGNTIAVAAVEWGLAFVLVGLAEEFSFRGYLQYTLTTGMGFWPSAALLSVLFAVSHARNPGESRPGLISIVGFALLFCLFLERRGTLWLAVGFHTGWDWGQTFFYGVPDSGLPPYHNLFNCSFSGPAWLTGGTVGPEASVFTPIVLALVAILFAIVSREVRYRADGNRPAR
jgi:uncharacterized protein